MSLLATSARTLLANSAARLPAQRLPLRLPKMAATVSLLRHSATPLTTSLPSPSIISSSFTTSIPRYATGKVDETLVAKLEQELLYEEDSIGVESSEEAWMVRIQALEVWKLEEAPGTDEVALTRKYGDEEIKVVFSIGDINNTEDSQFLDTDEDGQKTVNNADDPDDEGSETFSPHVRCAISITKPNKGALTIDVQAIDGFFLIENIAYYKDANLATELTAEADWKRRGLYFGPQFTTLDDDLQGQFQNYFRDRGLTEELAHFIPLYAEHKEQKEYIRWLSDVKGFVSAK